MSTFFELMATTNNLFFSKPSLWIVDRVNRCACFTDEKYLHGVLIALQLQPTTSSYLEYMCNLQHAIIRKFFYCWPWNNFTIKMYSSRSIWDIWVSYFEWGRWLGAGNACSRGILSSPNGQTRLTPLKMWRWRGNIRRAWFITKVVVQSCMNCTPGNVIRVESFASSCSLRRVRNEELFRSVWDESFATFTLVKFRAENSSWIT